MDGFDARITSRVPIIERQNPSDTLYSHGSYQARIVHLNTGDIGRDE